METPAVVRALLWVAVWLSSPEDSAAAVHGKSTLSLSPPWDRIFKGENVTLTCNGKEPLEAGPTTWTHNGSRLEGTDFDLHITHARAQHSGEYRCRRPDHLPSPPLRLHVFSDWLLIQSSANVVSEGESFVLRCHGWMNRNVYKVIYYKNGVALKYWYENYNMSFANVTKNDSGHYHCKGKLWQINYTSDRLQVTVGTDATTSQQRMYRWLQLLIPLLVGILFAVDTGLFVSTREQFLFLLTMKRSRRGNRGMDPAPRRDPTKELI